MPKISTVFSDAWDSMKQTIVETALDTAIQGIIDKMWEMATESDLAIKATNTALSGLEVGWLKALVPLWIGTSGEVADWVAEANAWLERFFGALGLGSGADNAGSVEVATYGGGGVVPGPIGTPQMAVVHGGEPIGAAGFAEVLDYERLGEAVYAGTYDALTEMGGNGGSRGSSSDLLTKLSQLLYDPTEVERERRGGTV